MRFPTRPSKASREALSAFYAGEVHTPAPVKKRGKQKESLVNEANQKAARLLGGELRRNRQGFAEIRPGVKIPFGLGTGTLDLVGPVSITVTPAMVGRVIAVYAEIESKTEDGVLAPHQQARIEHLRDMGAISGVSRSAEELQEIVRRWRDGR